MQDDFDQALAAVLKHEGGFVDHPADPGGATNRGVTLTVFQRHVPGAGVAELQAITDEQVSTIYHDDYWAKCRCDQTAAGIDYPVFDQAVNFGLGRSISWLQAAGAGIDGLIGPETIQLANETDTSKTVDAMCDDRLAFMQALRGGRQWEIFGHGWSRRVAEVRHGGIALANGRTLDKPHEPPALTSMLRAGDSGLAIRILQEALGAPVTGSFDEVTAVRTHQADVGLEVDGLAGKNTFPSLGLSL